jgi:hypothetical protein
MLQTCIEILHPHPTTPTFPPGASVVKGRRSFTAGEEENVERHIGGKNLAGAQSQEEGL